MHGETNVKEETYNDEQELKLTATNGDEITVYQILVENREHHEKVFGKALLKYLDFFTFSTLYMVY